MASLVGQQLKNTYDSLLKTSDNDALGGTYKEITDGSGNGSSLYLGTGGNVGIGNTSPNEKLVVSDGTNMNLRVGQLSHQTVSNPGIGMTFSRTSSDAPLMALGVLDAEELSLMSRQGIRFLTGGSNNYEYTTEAMRIDSDGNVISGSGGVTGNYQFTGDTYKIEGGNSFGDLRISAPRFRYFHDGSTINLNIDNGLHQFYNSSGTESMRIDSSGNVGIGDSTIANPFSSAYSNILQVGNTSGNTRLAITAGTSFSSDLQFSDSNTSAESGTYAGYISYKHLSDSMVFGIDTSERMRIDSSGNVLVGKTSADNATQGIRMLGSAGFASFVRAEAEPIVVNRLTDDGDLIDFRKDGTTIGSIGTIGGNIFIANEDTGLKFDNGFDAIVPATTTANRDNAIDLGAGTARFDDIYATNGTIQTSDRNEKQDIEELDDAELRVAQKAKTLLRKFRWKSSVEENENARIHFGIIAQDLEQAFTDEGLDAGRYGMFIKSTWTNEEGEEQTRLGVRYNQLLAFIISAL